jgi:hypothetical protein
VGPRAGLDTVSNPYHPIVQFVFKTDLDNGFANICVCTCTDLPESKYTVDNLFHVTLRMTRNYGQVIPVDDDIEIRRRPRIPNVVCVICCCEVSVLQVV